MISNFLMDTEITGQETDAQRIEAAIREHGFCVIKEEQLNQLFADGDGTTKRFLGLARLTHERRWSFEFEPHNGTVRITSLPALGTNGNDGVFSADGSS